MSVTFCVVGAVTDTSATVAGKVTGTSTRLAVADNPGLTSPAFYGPSTATNGMVKLTATGLAANKRYWFALEDDGVLDTASQGTFSTFPVAGSQASFTAAISSCASGYLYPSGAVGVSNSPIFDTVRNSNPLFFAHIGDMHYRDIAVNDVTAYRSAYDDVFAASRQHALYRNVPLVYQWDDHDYANDNSDSTAAGRPAAAQVFRERFPTYTLAEAGATYRTFVVGRVRFIVSDTRYYRSPDSDPDSSSKTMLGSAQKTWLQNTLSSATEEALVWLNPTPWLGQSSDTWAGFATERNELVTMFGDYNWLNRMVCINGDYHGLAMASGAGNAWGGFPVYVFGSLDSGVGSLAPDNQYDLGPTSPGQNRWGTLTINDTGSNIALTSVGRIDDTVWKTHSLNVRTSTAVSGGFTPVYAPDVSRVRISIANSLDNTLSDTFTRSVTNGWGTSDSGDAWSMSGGTAANYLTTSGVGRAAHTDVGTRRFTYAGNYADVDFIGQITAPSTPTGAAIQGGYTFRFTDANNFYCAMANFSTTGMVHVDIQKRKAGTITTLTSTVDQSFSPGFRKWFRVRAIGSSLAVKLWSDGSAEPDTWGATATDTDFTAGAIGTHSVLLSGNTNTLPVNIHFDNISPVTPATSAVVERSLNEVTWTTIRGGESVNMAGASSVTVDDYEFIPGVANIYRVTLYDSMGAIVGTREGTITPTIAKTWVKNLAKPWLNREVTVADVGEISRASRGGMFDVVGRTVPVAVTDVRGGRKFDLTILTQTIGEATDLDEVLAAGDPVLIQAPADSGIPTMYAVVGEVTEARTARRTPRRLFTLPLTEVAAPGPDVVGSTVTYQGVLNAYATYSDVLSEQPSYNAMLELIGSPTEVIVV